MTIRLQVIDSTNSSLRCGGTELVAEAIADERLLMWVDLEGVPVADEQALLNRQLQLPMAAVRSFQCERGPALEERGGYIMLRLEELLADPNATGINLHPVGFFFTQRILVTRHSGVSKCIDLFWRELGDHPLPYVHPNWIAVQLASLIAGRYLTVLATLESHLDALTDEEGAPAPVYGSIDENQRHLDRLCHTLENHCQIFDALDNLEVDLNSAIMQRLDALESNLRQGLAIAQRYRDKHRTIVV